MTRRLTRRSFTAAMGITAGTVAFSATAKAKAHHNRLLDGFRQEQDGDTEDSQPREAAFERDYAAPEFKPSWKNDQINRTMAQDFVIYAHSDLDKVKMLYEREPGLLNATLDWGAGDWETALGGASHMGRTDIIEFLLSKGARLDIFCATTMGLLAAVKEMLELQPTLIDAKGPHGFSLHWHAQVGQENAKPVLDHLQSIKEIELRPVPFLNKKKKKD